MITLGPILILAFAVSLPVCYILIIHRSLSGRAANDPDYAIGDSCACAKTCDRKTDSCARRPVPVTA